MIYFDHAATGWPKPPDVIKEVELTMRFRGGNPSRGGHPMSSVAGRVIYRCREKLAEHFGALPEHVIFTPGATYALSFAMKGIIGAGDHFLISDMEHNAVLRTARALQKIGASFDAFDAMASDEEILREISLKIRKNTVAVVCIHASNVISLSLPLSKIGKLCREKGIYFIADAAQSGGHVPISIEESYVDALCLPGHKGLLGPQGCGCMILSERMAIALEHGKTTVEGGSGIQSNDWEMPRQLPERFEPGTQPTPMIAGLLAGVSFVEKLGYDAIRAREQTVFAILRDGMMNMPKVHVYYPQADQGNILLFHFKNVPTEMAGTWFDREGICMRSGFHCSPMAHRKLNTGDGGAIRLSVGWNNTVKEAVNFLGALCRAQKELE